jgi:hypothetical protein
MESSVGLEDAQFKHSHETFQHMESSHHDHKLLTKAASLITLLETAAVRERPAARSAEESIPSALLVLELTGQL